MSEIIEMCVRGMYFWFYLNAYMLENKNKTFFDHYLLDSLHKIDQSIAPPVFHRIYICHIHTFRDQSTTGSQTGRKEWYMCH